MSRSGPERFCGAGALGCCCCPHRQTPKCSEDASSDWAGDDEECLQHPLLSLGLTFAGLVVGFLQQQPQLSPDLLTEQLPQPWHVAVPLTAASQSAADVVRYPLLGSSSSAPITQTLTAIRIERDFSTVTADSKEKRNTSLGYIIVNETIYIKTSSPAAFLGLFLLVGGADT